MLNSNQDVQHIFANHLEQIVKEEELVQQELALSVSFAVRRLVNGRIDEVLVAQ